MDEKFGKLTEGNSRVVFSSASNQLSALADLNGGLMIYALSETLGVKKAFVFSNEALANGSAAIILKNGLYPFYLVGLSNLGMTTGVKCAIGNNGSFVTLSGGNQTISFTASAGACVLPAFSPGALANHASTGFKPLEFISCASGATLGPFTETSTCTAQKGDVNHVSSLKVELVAFNSDQGSVDENNNSAGLASTCIRGAGRPTSNEIFTTADTQANTVFTLNSSTMFFGLGSNGVVKNTITGGADGFTGPTAIGGVNELHGIGSTVVAATNGGIQYSSNGGTSWSISNINTGNFLSIFAESATSLWAGKDTAGSLYRSTDGGANWTLIAVQANHGITSIETIFLASNGILYAGGTNGGNAILSSSTDGGINWTTGIFSVAEGGVWVVKVLNGFLYWGTNAGLYRSANTNASSPVKYCDTGCANTVTIPGNTVQDVTLAHHTLYVATSAGIGVNPGVDLTTWENYTTTELTAGNLNVQQIAFNNGRLYQAVLGAAIDPVRSTNSRGTGTAFPGSPTAHVPLGGTGSFLATKITTYSDPGCATAMRTYFYPEGLAGSGVTPNSSYTATRYGGGNVNNRVFLNDF